MLAQKNDLEVRVPDDNTLSPQEFRFEPEQGPVLINSRFNSMLRITYAQSLILQHNKYQSHLQWMHTRLFDMRM